MTDLGSCMNCRYAFPTFDDETGDPFFTCRRYPPRHVYAEGEPLMAFPTVDADTWCGEWTTE